MTKHIVKQRNIGMWVESGLYCVDQGPRTNWCMYNLLGVLMMFEYTLDISPGVVFVATPRVTTRSVGTWAELSRVRELNLRLNPRPKSRPRG